MTRVQPTGPSARLRRNAANSSAAGCILFASLLALLFFAAAPASARTLHITGFRCELDVLPDSTLDVTETIDVDFVGVWNGLYRTIPVEYSVPSGFGYSYDLTDIRANDPDPLRIERSRQGGNLRLKIYVPGATDAERTITLHYRVLNALRFFEDHDELYWNVTGNDWDVPLGDASARITLPSGVTGLRTGDYTGVFGSRAQDADITAEDSLVEIHTTRPLRFREGLTIVVGWDKGFVHEPGLFEKSVQFLVSNWPLFLPVIAALVMFWLWFTRGRDPQVGSIAVQYEPPQGLTPGEAGALIDQQASMRDITATIVDLAVHGFLTIEEQQKPHLMGMYSSNEYVFHMKKQPSEWQGVKPHEELMLSALFEGGMRPEVAFSELQNQFYKNLPGIRDALFNSLVGRGYYLHRPDKVRAGFLSGGIVTGVLLAYLGAYLARNYGMQPQTFTLAAVLTGAVICAFGWFMPACTVDGARARHGVLGFEDFLAHVEGDRLNRVRATPDLFEKFLPFAMALGVEKKWVRVFDGMFTQPPSWYAGPPGTMFQPSGFVYNLDQMSARAGQVMSSAPRSAGGSGFGGGGGSGGGGGGGGGGGF